MKHIAVILGTRPEAIKLAPLVHLLRSEAWRKEVRVTVVSTGQHRELLRGAMASFELAADIDLDVMAPAQQPGEVAGLMLRELSRVLLELKPDIAVAQGDTTTVMCASIAAFLAKVPFGHVEAGLRSGSLSEPFPEEMHRRVAALCAGWHFAPTEAAKEHLLGEGFLEKDIYVVGNTSIDALEWMTGREGGAELPEWARVYAGKKLVLVTLHRRESFGEPIRNVFRAIRQLAERFADIEIVYPLHPNPSVREAAIGALGGVERVRLGEALSYEHFVKLEARAHLILTDSGGVQEEAPSLGIPTLVLRNTTERPEAVGCGVAKLVGTDTDVIVREASRLLSDDAAYSATARKVNVYGDGRASERIAEVLVRGAMRTRAFVGAAAEHVV